MINSNILLLNITNFNRLIMKKTYFMKNNCIRPNHTLNIPYLSLSILLNAFIYQSYKKLFYFLSSNYYIYFIKFYFYLGVGSTSSNSLNDFIFKTSFNIFLYSFSLIK